LKKLNIMAKNALITGATAGIGEATARLFAQKGWNLVLTGRPKDRLDSLREELLKINTIEIETLCFDVRDCNASEEALNTIAHMQIDVLINNAGLAAGKDPIQNGSLDHWERMIDTNIKGLLYVTKLLAPQMIQRKEGHIVNIGSLAGKEVYANGNVYCATKHAVDALSRAMRIDLNEHSIKVTNIAPGLVETEFSIVRFDGDETKAAATYNGFDPLKAEDIADCIWFAASRPAHVTIGDMLILPTAQANSTTVNKK
jgi:NADP-dependent 3-hydroxy acid dehydrogenase YdfG